MSAKTYAGSCHCGAVKFEAEIDLRAGTGKCNCSFCTKPRSWTAFVKPDALRVLSGEDALQGYRAHSQTPSEHSFCRHCGVRTYERGHLEQLGGDYVCIHVASLDDASIDEQVAGPVRYSDGRNNNWMNPPNDTRNL
ncbi:MAG: GFA family protein [Sphingosinicella sp.]|nr:GFA family protein [Sphingosinicella sp.]